MESLDFIDVVLAFVFFYMVLLHNRVDKLNKHFEALIQSQNSSYNSLEKIEKTLSDMNSKQVSRDMVINWLHPNTRDSAASLKHIEDALASLANIEEILSKHTGKT